MEMDPGNHGCMLYPYIHTAGGFQSVPCTCQPVGNVSGRSICWAYKNGLLHHAVSDMQALPFCDEASVSTLVHKSANALSKQVKPQFRAIC